MASIERRIAHQYKPGELRAELNGAKGGKRRAARLSPARRSLIAAMATREYLGKEPWSEANQETFIKGWEAGYAQAAGWSKAG